MEKLKNYTVFDELTEEEQEKIVRECDRSSFSFLDDKQEDIYTEEDGVPIK